MDKPRKAHHREFLNRGNGMAAVEYNVECEEYKANGGSKTERSVMADLTLSDCNRQITLDFGVWSDSKTMVKGRREKARILEDAVTAFLYACSDAYDWMESHEAKH